MQNLRPRLLALATVIALFIPGPVAAVAQTFPDYLAVRYRPFLKHFVNARSLPERWLNIAGYTSGDYGRGFALIAGVSRYPRIAGKDGNLKEAAEDIRKLENYLKTYEKFDEIVVLTDAEVTPENLYYFLVTYFPRRLKEFPKSRFLFAYSGHGTNENDKGYLLTSEAVNLNDTFNAIPMTTVRANFQQVIDAGFHVLALINACYSGEFIKRSFGSNDRFIPKHTGAHAITAGGTKELAWADPTVGTGSVFFEKFFAALDGRAGRDGIVTVDELAAYLRREVQIYSDQKQNPLSGDLSRDGSLGGFFFFNRQPLVEAKDLPRWDARRGVPFGDSQPVERNASNPPPQSPENGPPPDPEAVSAVLLSRERERALKPKDAFKECNACPEMIVVSAGSFTMGSPEGEPGHRSNESPQRVVTFSRQFAVGRFAVTFDEWDACVADGGCNGYKPSDRGWGRGLRPVIDVTWDDAKAYTAWLSRKTGKTYRLLSEAEREYVTRAGKATPFWWGSSISSSQANYDGNNTYAGGAKGEFRMKTLPVNMFQPNPWGFYQVHGNVWEWVQDCWQENYGGAPLDGSARTSGDCDLRVIRGGSWNITPQSLRAANRGRAPIGYRSNLNGFRVGRTLTP
jgi:formylglycine-generating enzyme required for sulfatase activity